MKRNLLKVTALIFAFVLLFTCLTACKDDEPYGAYTESEKDAINAFFPESYMLYTDANGKNPITIERCTGVGVDSEGSRMFDPINRDGKSLEGTYINSKGLGIGSVAADFYGTYGISEDDFEKVLEDETGILYVAIETVAPDNSISFVKKDNIYEVYASFYGDPYLYMNGDPVGNNILIVEWKTDFEGTVTAYTVSHCIV